MAEIEDDRYSFGEFRLDAAEKVLRRDGEIVSLPAKVMDVLCLLVTKRGAVVSKEELMETVWADSFVEESNLTQSIYSLRRTLGTDLEGRTIIETLPKRGYRIAILVETNADRRSQDPKTAAGPKSYRIPILIGGIILIVLVATTVLAVRYWPSRRASIENVEFQRLTFSGDIGFPILSPDGKSFAYVKDKAIYLQDVATGSSVKLDTPGHTTFGNLQFSQEGESIYFRDEDSFDADGDLFQISRFGGNAKLVAEKVWSGVGLAADGSNLAFVRFYPKEGEWTLILKSRESGEERKLVSRNLPYTIYRSGYPAWSPDGKRIAIVEQTPEQGNISKLLLVNVDSGQTEPLETPQFVQIEQVSWLPEGRGLLISGRENNRFFQLWRMTLPGGELHRITNDLNIYRNISVSADGKQMLARQYTVYSHIWAAGAENLSDQKQITFGNLNRDGSAGLTWTPDSSIVYATRITGNIDIWSVRPSDGFRRQLTDNAGTNNENPFTTADGKSVYFESTRSGRRHIWRINADGASPIEITADKDETDFLPVVSPDGGTLYYVQRHPRSSVVWKQSLADGTRVMLTQQGKLAPDGYLAVSPDGRYLAFRASKEDSNADTIDVVIIEAAGGSEPRVITLKTQTPTIAFSDGGRSLDYADNQPSGVKLWRQPLDGNAPPKLLADIPKTHMFSFAWSPDGKTLALARGRQESDAILLENFE